MNPSPEIITNGGFDTDTAWDKGAGWSISAGVASASTTTSNLGQAVSGGLKPGRSYLVTYTLVNYTGGTVRVDLRGNVGSTRSTNGTYVEVITVTSYLEVDDVRFVGLTAFTGDIDNVSVKEVKTIAKPSTELVTNGGFDTDSGYTKDTGWTISGGKLRATSAGNSAAAFQGRLVEIGETVMVTFTVDSISEGAVKAFVGGSGNAGTARTTPGTYREIFVAGTPNTTGLVASGTTTCVIDNFSAKLVKALIK